MVFLDIKPRKFSEEAEELSARMGVAFTAIIALCCASVLLFFVYLKMPIGISTAALLFSIFLGTLVCLKSGWASQVMLVVSLIVGEFVILSYHFWLLLPFIALDVVVIISLSRFWLAASETSE